MSKNQQTPVIHTTSELKVNYEIRDWLRDLFFRFIVANPGTANRSQFLNDAGLPWGWIGGIPWGDDAQTVSSQIVQQTLELGEPLAGRSGYTALGAVLAQLVRRQRIGVDEARKIAAVVVRYHLIDLRTADVPPELRPFLQVIPIPLPFWDIEAGVRPASGFLNEFLDYKWFLKATRACQAVCRITLPLLDASVPTLFGTGFLVAPDLVLTNHHVIEAALPEGALFSRQDGQVEQLRANAADITLQFGYWQEADSEAPEQGQTYYLADPAWLVKSSPNQPDALDYALLRVQGTPGQDSFKGQPRGWVTKRRLAQVGEAILIVQHPLFEHMDKSAPLKIVMDANTVSTVDATRIRYLVNTEPGASGSPCFNKDWELVALHHAGRKGQYNEGIPIQAIYNDIASLINPVG